MLAHEIEVIAKYYSSTWHSAYAKITVMQCKSPGWLFGRAHASTPASLWRVGCNIFEETLLRSGFSPHGGMKGGKGGGFVCGEKKGRQPTF